MLDIYAGSSALKTIQEHGFKQELFTNFLGASGGPKWFSLFGLDKYFFGEFFQGRSTELNVIGSSAGAFRAACFAQKNPVEAISRLAQNYAHTRYNKTPSADDISQSAVSMLDHLFQDKGIDEVINNPIIKAHFIVAKSYGLTSFENKLVQGVGLLGSMLLNKVSRKLLTLQYDRYIYRPKSSTLKISDPYKITSHYVDFTPENISEALLASGSIPMVMNGIKNISGSPKGIYRDGGIIDYHFDFSLTHKAQGLTLYPHFNPTPKAGWFDKSSNRQVLAKSYKDTVLLVPSAQFIASLPYQKIPDRDDFKHLDTDVRIKYWSNVLCDADRLAEEFNHFIHQQDLSKIKPFQPKL
ncbi:MAG: patatin-like phospholipase family protein [Litorilituus sp.]|jgi:hypothetical protein|nr:patatin-like phospholipase family protein [Litorilituus sp.]